MHTMNIARVRLRHSAGDRLTANAHARVTDWLKQWTPEANFKACIAPTKAAALEKLRGLLQKELIPGWMETLNVHPEHFEFEVSEQEIDADGFFWGRSALVWCCWHPVKDY